MRERASQPSPSLAQRDTPARAGHTHTCRLLTFARTYLSPAPARRVFLDVRRYMELLREVIRQAGDHGILVALVCEGSSAQFHRGLWFNRPSDNVGRIDAAEVTPAVVDATWGRVAAELCTSWNLFAVDLQEEPEKAAWGQGWADADWHLAAEHIGNLVLRACPRWLVM
eukprot:878993-Prymnesium_polylepis.1